MDYTRYIIMPILIMIIYSFLKGQKFIFKNNIAFIILLGGGFFVSDTFDGYGYFLAIITLATIVVLIDYIFSEGKKSWEIAIENLIIILVIVFFYSILSRVIALFSNMMMNSNL